MRFPPNWSMELLLCVALFASVIVLVFAMREPPGDRTRFTLERSEAVGLTGERRPPLLVEETALQR